MKTIISTGLICMLAAGSVMADPPNDAPAQGYYKGMQQRDKYAKRYYRNRHYTGASNAAYAHDYGNESGKYRRNELGAVIGGVTGAVIGGQLAGPDDRVVGMAVGGILGAVLGHAIGDDLHK